ncbi:MAG: type II toxin-antitoxin system VapC family toxin [Bryobacteraceae bacterium]
MNPNFADTAFWIALVAPRDQLHSQAEGTSEWLASGQIITSGWILTEFLNEFAGRREDLRIAASKMVQSLRGRADLLIVPQTSSGFEAAFDLYRKRIDKGWSLTDCSSFLIMEQYRIRDALTYDRHFEQAGFTALLR